jgi:hypothetical protein
MRRVVYVAADAPVWRWVDVRARALGAASVVSFNQDYERFLRAAAGQVLVLTAVGERIVLPPALVPAFSPAGVDELRKLVAERPSGRLDRRLDDGTHVILLYGRNEQALAAEIERLTLDPA